MTTPALAQNVRGKGRHYAHPTEGLVPSVTNVIGILDKPALPRWAAKMVAERAALMKRSLPLMDDGDIVDSLKAVPWQRSNRAADRGTDIHDYLEKRLLGEEGPLLSDDARPYKAAADDWFENAGIEVWATELTVFHPTYAGTVDFVGKRDDRWVIGDFKTSKAIYPEAALQLSALWGCLTMHDGEVVPWRESGVEPCDLLVVRIGADGWEEAQVADPDRNLMVFHALVDAWHWKHTSPYTEADA